jgi:hypothetical protein
MPGSLAATAVPAELDDGYRWWPGHADPRCPVCGGYDGLDGREPVCRCGTRGLPSPEELVYGAAPQP